MTHCYFKDGVIRLYVYIVEEILKNIIGPLLRSILKCRKKIEENQRFGLWD